MPFVLNGWSQNGNHENQVEKLGMFLTAQKAPTKHHKYCAFHHKLTTLLPPQNTIKNAKPRKIAGLSSANIFPKNKSRPSGFRHQSR
jgi:hypothetical protein